MIVQKLQERIAESLYALYQYSIEPSAIVVDKTHKSFDGDYTLAVFPFLSKSKKKPEYTAEEIGRYVSSSVPELHSFNVVKGFLNLKLSDSFWYGFLTQQQNTQNFGIRSTILSDPVIVEYSSPNTNKPLHLGHIRNNLLGHAISEILQANGNRVVRVNLVNDRGIHISKSMLAYMKWGKAETPASSGMKGDHLVGKYYVLFDKMLQLQIEDGVASGLSPREASGNAPLMSEARELLRRWEMNDPEITRLWRTMNSWVYEGFDSTYRTLGIHFDKIYFESDTWQLGKKLIMRGLEEGKLKQDPDGSIRADLSEDHLDDKVLLRADGTSVYITQDIGTARLRYDEFHPSRMIYVVGNEQNHHFNVLQKVLSKLGEPYADFIFHLSYGMVDLPQGKMKSREGTVVDADDLMEEMFQTAEQTTRSLGKADEMTEAEALTLFRVVGLGALKYFILKVDPKKNMLFDPKESIDFNGNTGPFIQYTYARIQSLLKKGKTHLASASPRNIDPEPSTQPPEPRTQNPEPRTQNPEPRTQNPEPSPQHPEPRTQSTITLLNIERDIIKILYQFPEVVEQAGDELNPSLIAHYIYELAKEYNQFYQEVPVLKEENEETRILRLKLSRFTGDVIRSGMKLLGIDVPEKM